MALEGANLKKGGQKSAFLEYIANNLWGTLVSGTA